MKGRTFTQLAALIAALLLLNASLSFVDIWPTPFITWRGQVSIEVTLFVLALALLPLRQRRLSRRALAPIVAVWILLVLGRYAQVIAPALYGRDVNLYWDLRFIPDVVAMGTRVAAWWLVIATAAAILLVLALLYVVIRWAVGTVGTALTDRRGRWTIAAAAGALVALFVIQPRLEGAPELVSFSAAVTPSYAKQLQYAVRASYHGTIVPPSPVIEGSLGRLNGADAFLFFIEAYGATSFDRPEFDAALAPARNRFEAVVRGSGREVVSAFVDSPTFGGSSWLAHITLLSGIDVRDADRNAQLMAQHRDTLVRLFDRRGYRTVALMPGLKESWPEGAFYGFDRIYGAAQIGYHGPEFGWFAVPDQFSLERLRTLEVDRAPRPPLFVMFPTISTHFPFSPTPPYQPDWSRLQSEQPFDGDALTRAYAESPDWTNFGPGYIDAMRYDFASLGGFLELERDRHFVMILVGDHQPAAAVSGQGASWQVPVHVIADRGALLDRLVASGFRPGIRPEHPPLGPMSKLLPILLDAFGGSAAE